MKMKQAMIFDFDGTLADSMDLARTLFTNYAPDYNLPIPDDHLLNEWRGLTLPELMKKYGLNWLQVGQITTRLHFDMQKYLQEIHPTEGLIEILPHLSKSHALYIVTSNSQNNVHQWINHNNLSEYFNDIVGGIPFLGKGKKLKQLCKKHKIDLKNSYFVGDEVRDIEAGKKARLKTVAVSWGYQLPNRLQKSNPDFLVNHPDDLKSLL